MNSSVQKPEVGDRFRVRYRVKDLVGENYLYTWYLSTAKHVRSSQSDAQYDITLQYDDESEISKEKYPSNDIQRLVYADDDSSCDGLYRIDSLVYAMDEMSGKKVIAYDPNPSKLAIGDLVQCYYQNGGCNDGWYYGRVAAVNDNGQRVDVCYFDGDYECDIPLSRGIVYLIERGSSQIEKNWLLGAQIECQISSVRGKQNSCKGKVIAMSMECENHQDVSNSSLLVDQSHQIRCTIQIGRGKEQKIPYLEVLKSVFGSLKSRAAKNRFIKSEEVTPSLIRPTVVQPKVGDRFRIKYNVKDLGGDNFLCSWYFGTATKIRAPRIPSYYEVTMQYDDGTSISKEAFPSNTVQKIISVDSSNNASEEVDNLVYALDESNGQRCVAYDPNPNKLVVGDLVQCYYQNGLQNKGWFHGRVSAVSDDGKRFDVYYLDGDYEYNVPLLKGVVYLIERGSSKEKSNWLIGAQIEQIERLPGSRRQQSRKGKVISVTMEGVKNSIIPSSSPLVDQSSQAICTVQFKGRQEKIPYIEMVNALFASLKELAKKNGSIKNWPETKSQETECQETECQETEVLISAKSVQAKNLTDDSDHIINNDQPFWQRDDQRKNRNCSDWTIVLKSLENEKRIETFLVHKASIGAGEYRSDYFHSLFAMSEKLKEKKIERSEISLHDEMIDVFPFVLDFLYTGSSNNINTKRAVTILVMARYFHIQELVRIAEGIIQLQCTTQPSEKNCEIVSLWLLEAKHYADHELVEQLRDFLVAAYASGNGNLKHAITQNMPIIDKVKLLELSVSHVVTERDALEIRLKEGETKRKKSESALNKPDKRIRLIEDYYDSKNTEMPDWMQDIIYLQ